MAKVKMGFSRLTVTEQVERSRLITGKMTGNANFTTPNPSLSDVKNATDALETAFNDSRGRDKDKIAIMRLRRKDMLSLIVLLASYVQEASGGDAEKILSSGFDVAGGKTPRPDVAGKVNNLRLSDGSVPSKIRADWDDAADAVIYILETSLTADFVINDFAGCTTKTQKEFGSFAPGTRVFVRVFALGRENPGPRSEVVSILTR